VEGVPPPALPRDYDDWWISATPVNVSIASTSSAPDPNFYAIFLHNPGWNNATYEIRTLFTALPPASPAQTPSISSSQTPTSEPSKIDTTTIVLASVGGVAAVVVIVVVVCICRRRRAKESYSSSRTLSDGLIKDVDRRRV
jgi:hypothetical protein